MQKKINIEISKKIFGINSNEILKNWYLNMSIKNNYKLNFPFFYYYYLLKEKNMELNDVSAFDLNANLETLDYPTDKIYFSSDIHWFIKKPADNVKKIDAAIKYIQESEIQGLKVFSQECQPYEKNGKLMWGARNYLVCSWSKYYDLIFKETVDPNLRNFYEVILWEPVNLYLDCDKRHGEFERNLQPEKSVAAAMDEILKCFEIICNGNGWGFTWGQVKMSTLIADTEKKQSRHVVFHFPGNRMFRNFDDVDRFVEAAIKLSVERHGGSKDASPLYFKTYETNRKTKEEELVTICMIDNSVYSQKRNFRSCGNAKACEKGKTVKGVLMPINGMTLTRNVFLSHAITFIPLDQEGVPIKPILVSFGEPCENVAKIPKQILEVQDGQIELKFTETQSISARKLFENISLCIQAQIGYQCEISNNHFTDSIALVATRMRECPYKNEAHHSNHVFFQVFLNFPHPIIFYKCMNDICKLKRQLKTLELSPIHLDQLKGMIQAYLMETSFFLLK